MLSRRPLLLLAAALALSGRGCGDGDGATDDVSPSAAGSSAAGGGSPSIAGRAGSAGLAGAGGGADAGGVAAGGVGGAKPVGGGLVGWGANPGVTPGEGVPQGWVAYTDWSPNCPIWYPPTKELLPPPLEWQNCQAPVPAGFPCRELKHPNEDWWKVNANCPLVRARPDGPLLLQVEIVEKSEANLRLRFSVGEVDGPTLVAYTMTTLHGAMACTMYTKPSSEGYFTLALVGDNAHGVANHKSGALSGLVGSTDSPWLVRRSSQLADEGISSWATTSAGVIEQDEGHWLVERGTGVRSKIYQGDDPNGLGSHSVFLWRDEVFLDVGGLSMNGHYVWDKKDGLRPLLRWVDDFTRSASSFATDGTDMVWTYLEKKKPSDETWTASVMTAPYTLDRDLLLTKARRLTAGLYPGMSPYSWQVGCGYAAFVPDTTKLHIVRLADGASWTVSSEPWTGGGFFSHTLGVTCDEVFLNMASNVARIRFTDLGPPDPPK